MTKLDTFFKTVATRAGAADSDVSAVERKLGHRLPDDYKVILHRSNGLEGFVSPGVYLMLWPTSEIHSLNEAYSVKEFLPGVTLVGTDGSDTGYGFTWEGDSVKYVGVPLVGMAPNEMSILGCTFSEFLDRLQNGTAAADCIPLGPDPG